jgi:RNase adapter protein RapZ
MRLVVITGPSGAGKTLALHSLEDSGYYTVDNLPPPLLPALAGFCSQQNQERCAVVIDTRSGRAFAELPSIIRHMKLAGAEAEVLYLDASDSALLQRYKETRRPHPLRNKNREGETEGSIMEVIHAERALLDSVRACADHILDTSSFSPTILRDAIHSSYAADSRPGLLITVLSFGFKYGLPVDADLVFDVRFLANPFYVPELRPLNGTDPLVADYVAKDPNTPEFYRRMKELILFCLPEYMREGKAYLNIAIGCTGGKHRSVALSVQLTEELKAAGYCVELMHRDCAIETEASLRKGQTGAQ